MSQCSLEHLGLFLCIHRNVKKSASENNEVCISCSSSANPSADIFFCRPSATTSAGFSWLFPYFSRNVRVFVFFAVVGVDKNTSGVSKATFRLAGEASKNDDGKAWAGMENVSPEIKLVWEIKSPFSSAS